MATSWKSVPFLLFCTTVLFSMAEARWHPELRDEPCDIYTENYVCPENSVRNEQESAKLNEIPSCSENLVEATIALMDRGTEEIKLTEEAVMLIGTTGTGKTTLTYFLAGDNSKLIAYEKDVDLYLIKDCNGKISDGNSTIVSATIFPELLLEPSTKTAFYDNPGFDDTRDVCTEIAIAYFIRMVAENVRRLKFILVINEPSLHSGGDRTALTKMLNSVINFLPNVEKYGQGLGLIGTKLLFGVGQVIEDRYIQRATTFLSDNRNALQASAFDDPNGLRKAQFIVDTLINNTLSSTLVESKPMSSKIGLFRTPVSCGPMSDLDHMQSNKRNMTQMIHERLAFIDSSPDDFAFSLSSDAKLHVLEISRDLSKKVVESITLFATELLEHVGPQFEFDCVIGCGLDQLISDLRLLFSNPDFAADYSNESAWEGLNFTEVINRVVDPKYLPVSFHLSSDLSESLKKYGGYLDFLAPFDPLPIDKSDWFGPLKSLKSKVVESIRVGSLELAGLARTSLTDLTPFLNTTKLAEFKPLGVNEKGANLSSYISQIEGVATSLKTDGFENGSIATQVFIQNLLDKFVQLGLANSTAQNYSTNLLGPFTFFDSMVGPSIIKTDELELWLTPLTAFQNQMLKEEKWTDFLITLWTDLSHIKFQSYNQDGSEVDLKVWWQRGDNKITWANFSSFWDKFNITSAISGRKKEEFTAILETDTTDKLKNLNDLLSTSFDKTFNCVLSSSDTVTTVTGNFVTFVDILTNTSCLKTSVTKTVKVFAAHSIYIDSDFNGAQINGENNIDLTIISPTLWYATRVGISLDGTTGLVGNSPGGPGLPGKKAGNLISIGQRFSGNVSNSAKGGRGGNGVVGQTGQEGRKGISKKYFSSTSDCSATSGAVLLSNYYTEYGYSCNDHEGSGWCHADNNGATFRIYGGPGQKGGQGTGGGKSGIGGKGGHLYTVQVESGSKEDIVVADGGNGEMGAGGPGGQGGLQGDQLNAVIDDVRDPPVTGDKKCSVLSQSKSPAETRGPNGDTGITGGSSTPPDPPVPQSFSPSSVPTYFSQFKEKFLLQNNQFLGNGIRDFITKGEKVIN